jgi:hypothetical protein
MYTLFLICALQQAHVVIALLVANGRAEVFGKALQSSDAAPMLARPMATDGGRIGRYEQGALEAIRIIQSGKANHHV